MDATTYKKILYCGSYADLPASRDEDCLYFCTDNGKLYKGTVDFSDSFKTVTSSTIPAAASAVPGFIYYESDTHKFKTLLGGALVEIGNPIDAVGAQTTSTITASSVDDHVPSTKNVWLYGQQIKSEVLGDGIVDIDASTKAATLVVTEGDDDTFEVVVPGVITGVAKDETNEAQLIVTMSDDSTAAIGLHGVVTTPDWDEAHLKLTLPVTDGTDVVVNIPKDIFLEDATYDVTTREIVLIMNDTSSTEIRFSVSDIVAVYEAKDTTTVDTTINWNSTIGKYEVSADVNVSDATTNVLVVADDGLYVDGSQFAPIGDFTTLQGDFSNLVTSHNSLAAVAGWTSFTA